MYASSSRLRHCKRRGRAAGTRLLVNPSRNPPAPTRSKKPSRKRTCRMRTDLSRFGIACGLLLALAGCVDKANPDTIDTRAVERWNYLIAHQAEKAYDYLSPGFRSTQTREVYASSMNSRPVQWKE